MIYNLVIDADSILYTACYNAQKVSKKSIGVEVDARTREDSFNIEKAYMNFCATVSAIERMVFNRHKDEHIAGHWRGEPIYHGLDINTEIVFSPKRTFRNELSDSYKANRTPPEIFGIGSLKAMVFDRIGATMKDNIEADDWVITQAYELDNVYIGCIDKDIYTHSPVDCIDYKNWEWKNGLPQDKIEENYIYQALVGDNTDNITGCVGVGKVGADNFVNDMINPWTYDSWMKLYPSEEDALLAMRLVRLDQFKKGELVLWEKP